MIELKGKYTSAKIFADTIEEGVYSQVYDIINCPAFKDQKVVCMPDVHVGASGPCGLVATIGDYVCPEHIGVDIGCSVSMLLLNKRIPADQYGYFESEVRKRVPFGFNIHKETIIDIRAFCYHLHLKFREYKKYWPEMLSGLPDDVDERWISAQLKRLGMDEGVFYKSLGTVGGGNHFIEYDEQEGDKNVAGVTLHFGSRHFGVKVCKYWMGKATKTLSGNEIREITNEFKKEYIAQGGDMTMFKIELDKVLDKHREGHISGYLHGDDLKGYLCDMCFAQLYAGYNHLTVQDVITGILHEIGVGVITKICTTHNFIDLHDHTLRKSAIRSYKGKAILVPFNMRDGIAICEGLSNPDWLCSCAHGAGRRMSRTEAKAKVSMEEFRETMKDVYSTTVCEGTIDESPMAYKDTQEIVDLIKDTCEVKYLLKPKINIKAVDSGR